MWQMAEPTLAGRVRAAVILLLQWLSTILLLVAGNAGGCFAAAVLFRHGSSIAFELGILVVIVTLIADAVMLDMVSDDFRLWVDSLPAFEGPDSRQIRPGDRNPYQIGCDNHAGWESRCRQPVPRRSEVATKCDRSTNAPCLWSKTHPADDRCCMCGTQFAGWGYGGG